MNQVTISVFDDGTQVISFMIDGKHAPVILGAPETIRSDGLGVTEHTFKIDDETARMLAHVATQAAPSDG